MTRTESNAFLHAGQSFDAHPRGSLAGLLAPLRAVLTPTGEGQALTLSPLRLEDIMSLWTSFGSHRQIVNLLVDLGAPVSATPADAIPLEALVRDAGATSAQVLDDHLVLLDDEALPKVFRRKLPPGRLSHIRVVRITGLVEAIDARVIEAALRKGVSPLAVDLCAVASVGMLNECSLQLETRSKPDALRTVAESFRHYIAVQRRMSVPDIRPPEPVQVQRLLDLEGEICVRPLETAVYSTFIDVGVCAERGGPTRPAGHSLIYDVFSDSWHDEE